MATQTDPRSHETSIDLPATPAQVWKALTDANELKRWFPLDAEAQPGPGGFVRYIWGELDSKCPILVWEPERHLRIGWSEAVDDEAGALPLAVDFFLKASGGTTTLRVVHSGFGDGEKWAAEYDGTRRGWQCELGCLNAYLRNHVGRDRHVSWLHVPTKMPRAQAWQRLTSPTGLLRTGYAATLAAGDACELALATGDTLLGRVAVHIPPTDFTAIVDNHAGCYFRLALENCFGEEEAHVWISHWRPPTEQSRAFDQRVQAALGEIFES